MDKITLFRAISHGSRSHTTARADALDFPAGWVFASPAHNNFHSEVSDAVRMVRYGERFVRIELGGWDTHTDNARRTSALAATLDLGFSKLLDDLSANGMLDDTLILLSTEFGLGEGWKAGE